MPRLSIDITPEEHQKLKAIAALKGQSIKEFVLDKTLRDAPYLDEADLEGSLAALSEYLRPRIEQAKHGDTSTKTFEEIRREARNGMGL